MLRSIKFYIVKFLKKRLFKLFSDEDVFYENKYREFKKIKNGDILLCFGTKDAEKMRVIGKSSYGCSLRTLDNRASYYRTYEEIITKLN